MKSHITKKYIFTRKLAGKRVNVTYHSREEFVKALTILTENGILRRVNRGLANKKIKDYKILHDIAFNAIDTCGCLFTEYKCRFSGYNILRYETP